MIFLGHKHWDTSISYLKGVGPQRGEVLQKELRIFSLGDLVSHYPFRYVDKSKFYKVSEILPEMPMIQLVGKIGFPQTTGQARGKRLTCNFTDDTGTIELIWFKGIKFIEKVLKPGNQYVIFGKPSTFNQKINIVHPELELLSDHEQKKGKLSPVYASTEKLKNFRLDSKGIQKLTYQSLKDGHQFIPEILPLEIRDRYRFINRRNAIISAHFPSDEKILSKALARLKFEELLLIQLSILQLKKERENKFKGFIMDQVGDSFNTFFHEILAFDLTGAQKRVVKEIRKDLVSGIQMNRLLQGDVGSGKTVVALMSMLLAIDNGFQACIMAPTEILAIQHYNGIEELTRNLPVKVELLTGSSKTAKRKEIHSGIEDGTIHLLIGTHALIEDKVKFKNLGMAIIDEQHRFGVEQRSKLWRKNNPPPHILVMTATPIPRTLAMTLYGDLEVSVIDELPSGRKPIITKHMFDSQRLRVFGFMKEQIELGRQVYIVYPLIEESEKMDYKDLMDGYESITRAFPNPQYNISIVHGKMKPADKEFEMNRFAKGETQIMVATTVIEVGVNVPNASVMVIESAERFGLSQLHQLRGRVGRGAEQSYCLLMSGYKLSDDAKTRMETMVRTNDGFDIAETDLKLRGPGDITGTQQSGAMELKIADLAKDQRILAEARECAKQILSIDPKLEKEEHYGLSLAIRATQGKKWLWSRIS